MNLDVNLRHFLEVPKDLAIKKGGKEAKKLRKVVLTMEL